MCRPSEFPPYDIASEAIEGTTPMTYAQPLWKISNELAMIDDLLAKYEAVNTADVPFCMTEYMTIGTDPKTGNKYNRYYWMVDIHVRVPRVTEFTVEAGAPTLSQALRRAHMHLGSETATLKTAEQANARFGIVV